MGEMSARGQDGGYWVRWLWGRQLVRVRGEQRAVIEAHRSELLDRRALISELVLTLLEESDTLSAEIACADDVLRFRTRFETRVPPIPSQLAIRGQVAFLRGRALLNAVLQLLGEEEGPLTISELRLRLLARGLVPATCPPKAISDVLCGALRRGEAVRVRRGCYAPAIPRLRKIAVTDSDRLSA